MKQLDAIKLISSMNFDELLAVKAKVEAAYRGADFGGAPAIDCLPGATGVALCKRLKVQKVFVAGLEVTATRSEPWPPNTVTLQETPKRPGLGEVSGRDGWLPPLRAAKSSSPTSPSIESANALSCLASAHSFCRENPRFRLLPGSDGSTPTLCSGGVPSLARGHPKRTGWRACPDT